MKTASEISTRALIQGGLSFRSQLENHLRDGNEKAKEIIQAHSFWLEKFDLKASMSDHEQIEISAEAGSWDDKTISQNFWKIESLKALLWVLNQYEEMPAYFEVGNPNEIYRFAQYPDDPTHFIQQCSTRTKKEIEKEREVYEFLNWRCRTELFRLQGMAPPPGDSFEATVRRALNSMPSGSTKITKDENDIIINGIPLTKFADKGTVISTCYERHLALNWVVNKASWENVRVDT